MTVAPVDGRPLPGPSLRDVLPVWWRIGLLSFGGPAAQIALIHREVVEARGWLSERRFLDALSFCMLLPGPEAMQLATYAGWRMHGVRGGLVAGGLFVLPGAVVIAVLAGLYARLGDLPLVQALFLGVKAAVLVIVVEALLRVARRALAGPEAWVLAGAAFAALLVFAVPYPLVVAAAALWGWLRLRDGRAEEPDSAPAPASTASTLRTVAVWGALWLVPLSLLHVAAPAVLAEVGRFFSVLAVVTFGGAYAVLAYMTQEAVAGQGWLTTGEMMDALGLAETTPGPLILVTQFVGFLAAERAAPAGLGLAWGLAGAAVTLWVTFVPCFLFVFAGAPWIERLSARPGLRAALAGVSAAVVGVIANLSVWFGLHVLFATVASWEAGPVRLALPEVTSFDWRSAAIATGAAVLLLGLGRGIPLTLALCSAAGVLLAAV
ncbi:chromate efflux transporter [Jannaschia sp. LMIT008]|uniref:chromate efflux transporter n=1 Tax=Jannaschia maritima TaxID=3032585 RepID=UPI002811FE9A|nr:chromate efflux transporter [Jannaschia sp. LMIT008]